MLEGLVDLLDGHEVLGLGLGLLVLGRDDDAVGALAD